jgi:hypothetical protein
MARKDGYLDGTERVDIAIGPPRSILVRVQRVVGGTSEVPAEEPKAVGGPAAASSQPRLASDTSSSVFAASPEPRRTGVPARTVVLLSGAALTVGAATVGIVYAVRTGQDSSRISAAQSRLIEYNADDPGAVCNQPTQSNVVTFCQSLQDDLSRQSTDRKVRDIAFISAGVIGVATLATAILWRPRPATVSVAPVLNPAAPGLVVLGNF